jgi:3-phenylpropionate/cinnamic acid dioxygenase small subunit
MREQASPAAIELQYSAAQFYFREARLLDDRKFKEWVELFTDDARYVMPSRWNRSKREAAQELSAPNAVCHFDDDKSALRARVHRLESGMGWADEPASRTRHLIGNVEVLREISSANEIEVVSSFFLYRSRGEHDQNIFAGQRTDRLRASGAGFRIAHRRVLIDQSVILSNALNALF